MSPNTLKSAAEGPRSPLHLDRDFFPTNRQRALYKALNRAPNPGLAMLGYGGAMGGGKTRAIVELALDAALMYPGNNILVARHFFTDLSSTTMQEFFAACPERFIVRRQQSPTNLVQLAHPDWTDGQVSTVNFRHLTDWTGLGSQQYGAVLIDEAGEVDEDAARMLLTRLRHPAQQQRWFVAASNPWPGWFERWFVQRELPEQAIRDAQGRVVFIPAKVEDNPHLPADYGNLQRALLPQSWVDRFIEGRFDAFLGRVYPQFDPRTHCWTGPLPHFTRFIGGLDFGAQAEDAHHTAGIVAGITRHPLGSASGRGSDPSTDGLWQVLLPPDAQRHMEGFDRSRFLRHPALAAQERQEARPYTLIRLAEFEDRGPGVYQRLEQWQRRCRERFGPIRWCADRSQSAWIDDQRRRGVHVVPANGGPDSVNWGIALVQERLEADPPTSYYTPELTIFPERVLDYQWQRSQSQPIKPRKKNDDLLDADRYMHELALKATSADQPTILHPHRMALPRPLAKTIAKLIKVRPTPLPSLAPPLRGSCRRACPRLERGLRGSDHHTTSAAPNQVAPPSAPLGRGRRGEEDLAFPYHLAQGPTCS